MKALLRWWLIFCLSILAGGIAFYFDIHKELYNADQTKISFLILTIFIITSIWIGVVTKLQDRTVEIGWFIAEACLALGMVGTVTGFLLMLGTSFTDIDVNNSASLQEALINMALGMSTALYTTLIGLVCSLLIKVQLVNFEVSLKE